jgi:predicted transposase/invertase (TIGR01784 family)
MGYRPEEKVQLKLEFLRMLTKMSLDPARMTLLTGFFETYLKLNKNEEQSLEHELSKLPAEEANKMMEITTSWHEKGRMAGFSEGEAEGIKKGKSAGKIEGKLEMAKNLLLMGINLEAVAKAAELPMEKIIELQKSLPN